MYSSDCGMAIGFVISGVEGGVGFVLLIRFVCYE